MAETVPEQVAAELQREKPRAYCDDCLAARLGKNRRQIQPITKSLQAGGWSRAIGKCDGECGSSAKFVTHA